MQLSSKEKYRRLCREENDIPIFSRDWWLDIVCRTERWDVLLFEEKDCIRAAFPVYMPASNIISMPPFTQTMGIWFAPETEDTKYLSILSSRQAIAQKFIVNLPAFSSFLQNFNYNISDWLPFYWKGFEQTTRYTYILKDINNQELLWNNMNSNIRRNISKAKEKHKISVCRNLHVDELISMVSQTFDRQNLKAKHLPVLKRLVAEARKRNQGDIWGGFDSEGNLHAAAFIVWQKSSAYYIAGGSSASLRSSGAHSLVLWEAVRAVSAYTGVFDFEGSMIPGVERFFREFGGIQMPYFSIYKGKPGLFDRFRIRLGAIKS
ncbi:MAG: GNAT family N-acetyltransferase [Tannerellaceae bacterium]|jgi:hypothetical protein|nr:GNAT family N-acetyltransferase [Tannerellaceae bacterium]